MTYKQFDVVVVPFTDTTATKKRPAVVVSNTPSFNQLMKKSVMAMITTTTHTPWALDTSIMDLKSAGLKTNSLIRMKLFTLDGRTSSSNVILTFLLMIQPLLFQKVVFIYHTS